MPMPRIDCNKAEHGGPGGSCTGNCKNCGRPLGYKHGYGGRLGRYVHRRGYKRMFPDPRKAGRPEGV